jgi:cell division protease FtsH
VSILSRGRSLGTTSADGADDASLVLSRSQLQGRLVTLMAGTAAEVVALGEPSTGAEQDIDSATDLARDIVARFGMSEELGPVRLFAKPGAGFLGDSLALAEISSETKASIDRAVRLMVVDAQQTANRILERHRGALDALAARLDVEETIEGQALRSVLEDVAAECEADDPVARNGVSPRRRKTLATSLTN